MLQDGEFKDWLLSGDRSKEIMSKGRPIASMPIILLAYEAASRLVKEVRSWTNPSVDLSR